MVEANLWIPELGAQTDPAAAIHIAFLVDTGADMTVLHPQDSEKSFSTPEQWNWLREKTSVVLGGAGRFEPHYQILSYISLVHADATVDFHPLTLYVPEPHPAIAEVESLLGRDVLGQYRTLFDRNITLTLETSGPADPVTSTAATP